MIELRIYTYTCLCSRFEEEDPGRKFHFLLEFQGKYSFRNKYFEKLIILIR